MAGHTGHRPSTCRRHPTAAPSAGFCASCLCERLASVDPSITARHVTSNRSPCPDHLLHRSRSYSAAAACDRDSFNSNNDEARRKSCDSRDRGTLTDPFSSRREQQGSSRELNPGARDIRICDRRDGKFASVSGDFEGEAELRTMREFIDLEWQSKSKKQRSKEDRSFWDFSEKLRKWRRKGKKRNQEGRNEVLDYSLRRRSCDMESATAARASVDYARNAINSFDEPRVSLDGYLLGRTYRLTPLVSVLEDTKIIHSGLDCHEKPKADLDRSGSRKKGAALEVGEPKLKPVAKSRVSLDGSEIFYRAKLVITERELMEWNSNSKLGKEEDGSGTVPAGVKRTTEDAHNSILAPSVVEDREPFEKSWRWWSIRRLMWWKCIKWGLIPERSNLEAGFRSSSKMVRFSTNLVFSFVTWKQAWELLSLFLF